MNTSTPWKTGVALALTLATTYSICALLYALWPDAGIDFLNALFHGLDFRKLLSPQPFGFWMFLYPLLVMTVWGFVVGTLFAWLNQRLQER